MSSADWEERERWKKIRAERDRKKREFNSLYQLVEVEDYLHWTTKEPRKGGGMKLSTALNLGDDQALQPGGRCSRSVAPILHGAIRRAQ